MKQILTLLLLVTLGIVSCSQKMAKDANSNENSKSKVFSSAWSLDSAVYEKRVHIDNDTAKEGMSISLFYRYPQKAPDGVALKAVQQTIARIYTNDADFEETPQQAFEKVRDEFEKEALNLGSEWQKMADEFGDSFPSFADYEQLERLDIDAIYDQLLTLSSSSYAYTGGAHGYGANLLYNIDLKDGKVINDTMLYNPEHLVEVEKLLQAEVTRRNAVEDSEDAISLLVEMEEIKPNNNFFFTQDGIVYLYNQYEIAPYAQGAVEINIPYDKMLPLVSESYRKVIEEIAGL